MEQYYGERVSDPQGRSKEAIQNEYEKSKRRVATQRQKHGGKSLVELQEGYIVDIVHYCTLIYSTILFCALMRSTAPYCALLRSALTCLLSQEFATKMESALAQKKGELSTVDRQRKLQEAAFQERYKFWRARCKQKSKQAHCCRRPPPHRASSWLL